MRTADVEAIQKGLTARALYGDKIDGKAGMSNARGARRLPEGQRPQARLLADFRGAPTCR